MGKKKIAKVIGGISAVSLGIVIVTSIIVFWPVSPILDEEFITTYSCLCDGMGVDTANEYNDLKEGIHPIILIQSDKTRHELTDEIPPGWWPENITDVELVLVCDKEEHKVIETCHYYGPDITRYQYHIVMELREAKTGSLLAKTTIKGALPRQCRQSEDYDLTELWGKHVTIGQISKWLNQYVVT